VECLKDAPLKETLALLENIRLGWKSSSLLRKFLNYGQKSFIRLASGPNIKKLFASVFTNVHNKLECSLSLSGLSRLV
jgi:hypothetical protein